MLGVIGLIGAGIMIGKRKIVMVIVLFFFAVEFD
jgi:hypothetical protein